MKRKKNKKGNVVSEHINAVLLTVDPLDNRPLPVEVPEGGLDPKLDLISQSFKHVDGFIEDAAQPECLRVFLDRARMPGHGMHEKTPYPKLFATYVGEDWRGYTKGDRVRVTMASRMGDVGVTKNMSQDFGYDIRCSVDSLSDFSAEA